jgi:excisionase family DNA binding protein
MDYKNRYFKDQHHTYNKDDAKYEPLKDVESWRDLDQLFQKMAPNVNYSITKQQDKPIPGIQKQVTHWYTISDIEEKYPISRRKLLQLIRDKAIPHSRTGKKYIIKHEDIEAYFEKNYTGNKH